MSATNLTKNLKLPQFLASDKPSWLGDVNGAMLNIDNGVGVMKADITKASDTASNAKSQSDANAVSLGNVNNELENIANRVTALEAGGGTEQLEQKVNTNTSDIESLQTRADTFEEEIAENGSNISNVTNTVNALTPRVKSCEDNIVSLTATTQGLSDNIESTATEINEIKDKLPIYPSGTTILYGGISSSAFNQPLPIFEKTSSTGFNLKNIIFVPRTTGAFTITTSNQLLAKFGMSQVLTDKSYVGRTLITTSTELYQYGTTIYLSFSVDGDDLIINFRSAVQTTIPSAVPFIIPSISIFFA